MIKHPATYMALYPSAPLRPRQPLLHLRLLLPLLFALFKVGSEARNLAGLLLLADDEGEFFQGLEEG